MQKLRQFWRIDEINVASKSDFVVMYGPIPSTTH